MATPTPVTRSASGEKHISKNRLRHHPHPYTVRRESPRPNRAPLGPFLLLARGVGLLFADDSCELCPPLAGSLLLARIQVVLLGDEEALGLNGQRGTGADE